MESLGSNAVVKVIKPLPSGSLVNAAPILHERSMHTKNCDGAKLIVLSAGNSIC